MRLKSLLPRHKKSLGAFIVLGVVYALGVLTSGWLSRADNRAAEFRARIPASGAHGTDQASTSGRLELRAELFAAHEELLQARVQAKRRHYAEAQLARLKAELESSSKIGQPLPDLPAKADTEPDRGKADRAAAAIPRRVDPLMAGLQAEAAELRTMVRHQRHLRDLMASKACPVVTTGDGSLPELHAPKGAAGRSNLNEPDAETGERFALGLMAYECERYRDALRHWMFAAEAGLPMAKFHLAGLLLEGKAMARNRELARAWLESAKRGGSDLSPRLLETLSTDPEFAKTARNQDGLQ